MFGRSHNSGGSGGGGHKSSSRQNSNANLRGSSNNGNVQSHDYGHSNMLRDNSRSSTNNHNKFESDSVSAVSSVFSTSTNNQAPSTLGGATSLTGGMESLGMSGADGKANTGAGWRMNDSSLGQDSNHTLGNIANEMIDGYSNNNNSSSNSANSTGQRRDTLYEDARESVTPLPGAHASMTTMQNGYNSGSTAQQSHQARNDQGGRTPQMEKRNQASSDNQQSNRAKAGDGKQDQTMKRQGSNQSNTSGGNHGGSGGNANNSSLDEWGSRGGAGLANASQFEQTDAASFIGQDPIAQAGDFMDDDAEVTFVSSEMGMGANRQPMTRFRIHAVNLNVHSPVLSELVDDRASDDSDDVRLEEDAATLKLLFGLMYNRSAPALGMNEWQVVLRLARCAQKYDVARAKEVAAAYFTEQEQLGALSPFMTYAFAVQYKLPALEESAAERSTKYDLARLPELVFNMMGFNAFQSLASFHSRRQTHYQEVLNSIAIDPKELADQCYQTGGVCVVSPLSKLKNKLAWPRQTGRDGSKRPPEPADVLRKLVTEIGQIDCGTCSKALVESALQVQLALESMPSYNDDEDAF